MCESENDIPTRMTTVNPSDPCMKLNCRRQRKEELGQTLLGTSAGAYLQFDWFGSTSSGILFAMVPVSAIALAWVAWVHKLHTRQPFLPFRPFRLIVAMASCYGIMLWHHAMALPRNHLLNSYPMGWRLTTLHLPLDSIDSIYIYILYTL